MACLALPSLTIAKTRHIHIARGRAYDIDGDCIASYCSLMDPATACKCRTEQGELAGRTAASATAIRFVMKQSDDDNISPQQSRSRLHRQCDVVVRSRVLKELGVGY